MEDITAVLVSWEPFLLALGASAVIGMLRKMGSVKDANGKVIGGWAQGRVFKMLLPVLPYVFTLGFVFIPGVPMPEKVGNALGAKLLYALWCGWLSDKVFEIVKRVLDKGFGLKFGAAKDK